MLFGVTLQRTPGEVRIAVAEIEPRALPATEFSLLPSPYAELQSTLVQHKVFSTRTYAGLAELRDRGIEADLLGRRVLAVDTRSLHGIAISHKSEGITNPGQHVSAHPQVVRGPNRHLVRDPDKPVGLAVPLS